MDGVAQAEGGPSDDRAEPMSGERRIVVVGAGAVGGVLAVGLALAGRHVEVVARGDHLATIQAHGLTRRAADGEVTVDLAAHPDVAAAQVTTDDVVVIATKAHQAGTVLDQLLTVAGDGVTVACATNGVEVERLALRRVDVVLGVLVNVPAVHLEPGVVEVYASAPRGLLDVGRYPHGTGEAARWLSAQFEAAEFTSEATDRVMARKWAKLLGNVGNVCPVLCGRDPSGWTRLYEALRAEAEAVIDAAGVDVDLPTQQHRATLVARADIDGRRRPGGSTWQSVVRGTGNIETVALNGEITLLGRLHGVATPVNSLVQSEALRLVAQGVGIGTMDQDDLLQRAGREGDPMAGERTP